jgi:hypothetical protein
MHKMGSTICKVAGIGYVIGTRMLNIKIVTFQ